MLVDDMKSLIRSLGVEDRVTLHGVIRDRDTLKQYYAAARSFSLSVIL